MNLIKKYKIDPNILNIYQIGSQVYGTATPESDTDLILVVKDWFDSKDIDVHVYTIEQFEMSLKLHDIQALECVCVDKQFIHKENHKFEIPTINLNQLRKSISTICNNSWVKGKKKLIISGDYDLNVAIKSIFHSLRIYHYGFQLATKGKIYNYQSVNYIMFDLRELSEIYQNSELWTQIESKYKKTFNRFASNFKEVAPKDLDEKNKTNLLEKVLLNNFGIIDENLKMKYY